MPQRPLYLGRTHEPSNPERFELPPHHLGTHGVIVGMTGSGKTGLLLVLIEEALRSRVPALLVDVKGDLPNLLLAMPALDAAAFLPWVDADAAAREGRSAEQLAGALAERQRAGLEGWQLGADDARALREGCAFRVLSPGSTAGEPVHVLSALERPSALWASDEELAREVLGSSVSLLLRLVGRDGDPRAREHIALSLFAERHLRAGRGATLEALLADLARPPLETVGALPLEQFLPAKERASLAQELNALLASPSFGLWRRGAPLDVGAWLAPAQYGGKTPAVIVTVAHLDDDERALVLGLLLDAVLAWVRTLPGSSDLRALVAFDELYGFLPPHPANPPTKRPLLALMKQARAFGVGALLATQNPMDVDYKALSNAGVWFVGRLQTDADRARVVEGLAGSDAGAGGLDAAALGATLKALPPRTFFVRNVHASPSVRELSTRHTLSWLRGPMTRHELRRLTASHAPPTPAPVAAEATPATPPPPPPPTAPAAEAPHSSSNGPKPVAAPPAPPVAPAPVAAPAPSPPASPVAPPPNADPPAGAPAPPDGWRVWHAHPSPAPLARWRYLPWVCVTVVAHVRDAKLGVNVQRTRTLAAPLGDDARPALAQAIDLPASSLAGAPPAGARYASLPTALFRKGAAAAVERALRDHAGRSLEVPVALHRELGLVQAEREALDEFAARCRAEASRRADAERATVLAKHAPRVARLEQKREAARAALHAAERAAQAAPGVFGALALRVVAGQRTARAATRAGEKAAAQLARARAAAREAEAAVTEALAKRDAEALELQHRAARAHEAIERRSLTPKRADVEVTAVGLAWAVG